MYVKNSIQRVMKILFILLFVFSASYSYAATPAGYSDYLIPGDERLLGILWYNIGQTGGVPSATSARHRVISVVAWSPDTKVYYDHWLDGYNFDPDNPDATADEVVVLTNKGSSKIFESANIALPQTTVAAGTCKTLGACAYSGKDRIYVAGGVVSVTTESWVQAIGNVFTIAWDVYPVKPQMTTYILPFGEDLAAAPRSYRSFDRVFALLEATEDNTLVQIDFDQDGTWDNFCTDKTRATCTSGVSVTLNKGEVFLLDDTAVSPQAAPYNVVHTGTLVNASATIQVNYVIGNHNDNYQGRGFSAFPRGYWDTEYYSPADSTNGTTTYPTNIFIYNPNTSTLTINYQTTTGTGSFTVPAGETRSMREQAGVYVPQGSGVYLSADSPFWGVTNLDDGGQVHEWGYGLIPAFLLGTEQYLGWAPAGSSTLPAPVGNRDDGGIYITPAQDNTRVFVDTNQDGSAEYTYTLNRNQTQFVYNTVTGDMSNSHIWATGPISLAYGQNPATSPTGSPAIDLGYSILPGGDWIDKVLTVSKTANPVVVPTAIGSQSTYTLSVNSYHFAADGISVVDTLPTGWQYVSGTTTITLADKTTSSANPSISGQTLTWSNALLGSMAANQTITITFKAQTTQAFNVGDLTMNQVQATGTRTVVGLTQTFSASDFAFNTFSNSNSSLTVAKSSCVLGTSCTTLADPLYPGNSYTYMVQVTNPASSTANQTGIAISDPLPSGVSYVAGSGSVTCELVPQNVRDEFASAAYNLNGPNNTATWATNWTEADSGAGIAGATDGFVWVTGNALQFRYITSNARDQFDNNNTYAGSNGSILWSANWIETLDDGTANGGTIRAASNTARFRPGNANRSLSRTVNLAGASSATISFLPTDTSIVGGETLVAEYSLNGGTYLPIGTYDGGTAGWSGVAQTLTVALPVGTTTLTIQFRAPQAWAGTHEARVDNVDISISGAMIQRTANLTGASSAFLNFSYTSAGLAAGDTLVVEASTSATGPFTTLATFTAGTPNVAPPYNLKPYISANTTIRYRITGGFNAAGKTLSVDNVDITYYVPSTFAAGSPPNFLSSATGCRITPSNSLSLTYNVTVDNPLATGIDKITNTAFINSHEIILPLSASVTNIVVNPSSQSATVGDRVWFDINGDGILDVGEPGLANVEVTLKDRYGTPLMTTTTDSTGHYLFTGVTPGNGYYVEATDGLPSGLQQSAPSGRSDNRTAAFNLTGSQSYAGADLGYKSASGYAAVGNLVWSDANSNSTHDPGEAGIGGVTVQLCFDADGDGIWDTNEQTGPGCRTATTAPDGSYLFAGVPAGSPVGTEDYFVYVDGAQASLAGYTRTTPANDPLYVNNLSAGDVIQYADFGYHGTTYSITDRVWFDANGNGSLDAGETGIALVTVDLLDASLNAIATTITDTNGSFTFSGVTGGGADYTVRITDTNNKLTDYFATTSSATTRSLQIPNLGGNVDNTSSPHFGYSLRGAIGDTVFYDTNGNGSQDTGEPGSSGITVKLYSDSGTIGIIDGSDAVVATVTTDANGRYLFSGRANGNYIVSIESPPSGYTYTGADSDTVTTGQQQSASIISNGNVLNKDFGYQVPPVSARSVSGRIWNDLNNDGSDAGESGIAGVTIDLLLGSNVIAATTSASDGNYSFTGLPGNTYTVRITDNAGVLSGYITTYEKTELTVSPFNGQETVVLTSGNQTGVNFGYVSPVIPTLAVLSSFGASVTDGQVIVEWETASEHNTLGFYLFRLDAATGAYRSITDGLLPGLITDPKGGSYSLIDRGAFPGETYRYKLVEVERDGKQIVYGPFSVSGTGNVAGSQSVRTNSVQASGTGSGSGISDYSRKARQQSAFMKSLIQIRSVSETTAATQQQAQTSLVKGSRIKIPISENGLYYMDAKDISDITGVNYSLIRSWIGTKFLSMSNQGRPVAYLPAGNNAGLFFYGTGTDSVYTRNNIYWIDTGKGLTMKNETGPVPAPPAPDDAFSDSLHIEKDVFPNMGQTNNPAEDYWDWDMIYLSPNPKYSDGPKSFKFLLNGKADTQNEASLQVHLVGGSDSGISNDHHVVIKLNGQQIGKEEGELWGGLNPYTFTAAFNQSLLKEGENTIEVRGLLDKDIPFSMFLIDSFDLTYERLYEADGNKLFFKGDGNQSVRVKGFTPTTPDILLFNITNPETPILNTSAITDGSTGDYGISFKPVSADARYLAIARDAAVRVVNAQGANRSLLRLGSNRGDYLIIAPDELASAVKPLSDYRYSVGMQSKVVTVDDIMNEFNFGLSSPEAIKQFLTYAYKYWSRKPKYVLLAGGGTWDYRDNEGEGGNLIPPAMVPTPYGLSTSDNYLADINGDHVPEMAIGRVPVLTPQDMQNVIAKIKSFEAASGRRVVLVADNFDDGGNFSADSENIAGLFPSTYILEKVYLDEYPSTDLARMTLFNYINAGSVFFNYIGHASFDMFTAEGLFTSDDIASLANGTGLPVVTAMTCTAGEFAIPGYPTISQLMVLQNGVGAAAFWSATGLSDNTEAKILNREFYNAVFNSTKKVLGDAVLQALGKYKTGGSMPFMMDIYTILGDPALKLR